MAHALYGYDGPCKNIHGHSYRLEVTLIGEPKNDSAVAKNGMVMDFTDLKASVKTNIVDVFDHALVLNGNSPHRSIPDLDTTFEKVIFVDYQPTCENLLADFKNRIISLIPSEVELKVIRLHETASSYAEWRAEDN